MQDSKIIELYFARDEMAISATSEKYSAYCMQISMNILGDHAASEECVNDTYLAAWNSIPPNKPDRLSSYLGALTRNLSINRYKAERSLRRGGGEFALSLDELDDCIADDYQGRWDSEELGRLISEFLFGEREEMRVAFVRRYFYSDSIDDIAKRLASSPSKVKSMLHRTRLGLKKHLEKNNIQI